MYLKELRINGFKSFALQTRLDLHPGVTAIVGPNGCGKSNIADALRWVLGESSAKSLRAGAMSDVIFQGTTHRAPLNLAEVFLLFTDCEKELGPGYAEVEVGRRVNREGGSDYYLNGKRVRRRDVQQLFLDTGIGQVSYSFMLQGQIDQILSNDPAERRAIFEEAAGISRYKTQRREALQKLESVDANLARVTDVLDEVSRQIGTLKRQAAKAIRYRRIDRRRRSLDLALKARRFQLVREDVAEHERKLAFLEREAEQARHKLAQAEEAIAQKRNRRNQLQAQAQQLQQEVFEARSKRDQGRQRIGFAEERLGENGRRRQELSTQADQIEDQLGALQTQVEEKRAWLAERKAAGEETEQNFTQQERALAELQRTQADTERAHSQARMVVQTKESGVSRLRSRTTTLEVDLKTFQARHAQLATDCETLQHEVERLEQEAAQIREIWQQRQAEHQQARERVEAVTGQIRAAQDARRSAEQKLAALEQQHTRQEGQIAAWQALQDKLEGFSQGAKALVQGKLQGALAAGEASLLLQHLRVTEGYGAAIEALLGAAGEGVWLRENGRVSPVIEALRAKKFDRVALLFNTDAPVPEDVAFDGLKPARSLARTANEDVRPVVERLLAGCYYCADLPAFLQAWREQPDFHFRFIVTPEGELVDGRGLIQAGGRSGQAQSSYLERARQIDQAREALKLVADEVQDARQAVEVAARKVQHIEQQAEEQRKRLNELAQELSTLQGQSNSAVRSHEQAVKQLQQRRQDLAKLETQRTESAQRLETAQQEMTALEQEIGAAQQQVTHYEAEVQRLRQEVEKAKESFNEERLARAERRQQIELGQRDLQDKEQQLRRAQNALRQRREEATNLRRQDEDLQQQLSTARTEVEAAEAALAKGETQLATARQELEALDKDVTVVEKGLVAQREGVDRLNKEHGRVEVALAKLQTQRDSLLTEAQGAYELDIAREDWRRHWLEAGDPVPERLKVEIDEWEADEAVDEPEVDTSPEALRAVQEPAWEPVAKEVDTLRQKLGSLGTVNLLAIEEYKELKERHHFLKTQSDDLWQSKDQLMQAIDEINTTSERLFAETFEQIRKNFAFTFEQLFGGGKAELNLIDAEDVLESGVEIIAQPPGTRLKSLQLLSGGQKTMTAVALLFAVYMVKPSPFAVLDELDAPLDDANIGRFCDMVKRFTDKSQFLLITHSKRTISIADTIYGVTMQERGVSRVVSMRFNHHKGEAEVA
ncbi:MAG: chromosome segregation protein SMC [Verrucomicrobiota bacterium JB022]|nr:chromosome segregation protein SMC [Verrucomicrobiota bacterium JB022]